MKEEIIAQLIEEQEKVKLDIEKAINERQSAADIDEDTAIEADDISQQEVNKDFIRKIREQLDFANFDLATLKTYLHRENQIFGPGAVVETKDYYFVVGLSLHNSEFKGKKVVGISKEAPVYEENEGKTEKDKMKIGKKNHDILNLW